MRIQQVDLEHVFDLAGLVRAGALGKPKPGAQFIGAQVWSLVLVKQEIDRAQCVSNSTGPAFGSTADQG